MVQMALQGRQAITVPMAAQGLRDPAVALQALQDRPEPMAQTALMAVQALQGQREQMERRALTALTEQVVMQELPAPQVLMGRTELQGRQVQMGIPALPALPALMGLMGLMALTARREIQALREAQALQE
jgi:hypothetical protein